MAKKNLYAQKSLDDMEYKQRMYEARNWFSGFVMEIYGDVVVVDYTGCYNVKDIDDEARNKLNDAIELYNKCVSKYHFYSNVEPHFVNEIKWEHRLTKAEKALKGLVKKLDVKFVKMDDYNKIVKDYANKKEVSFEK